MCKEGTGWERARCCLGLRMSKLELFGCCATCRGSRVRGKSRRAIPMGVLKSLDLQHTKVRAGACINTQPIYYFRRQTNCCIKSALCESKGSIGGAISCSLLLSSWKDRTTRRKTNSSCIPACAKQNGDLGAQQVPSSLNGQSHNQTAKDGVKKCLR